MESGDIIRFRKNGKWARKGKIIGKSSQPRSYKILTDKGTVIRRNRRHLLQTKETFEEIEDIDTDSNESNLGNIVNNEQAENNTEVIHNEASVQGNLNNNISDETGRAADQAIQPNNTITTRYGRTIRRPRHLDIYEQ